MSEGKGPAPFGLITPDALFPCLFTLVQQLGEEWVNEASSPSTAWVTTSTRELRSLSGPCQTVLRATSHQQPVGIGVRHMKPPPPQTGTAQRADAEPLL